MLAILISYCVISICILSYFMITAPFGYEDENGFYKKDNII
jgi:hypothetical protein